MVIIQHFTCSFVRLSEKQRGLRILLKHLAKSELGFLTLFHYQVQSSYSGIRSELPSRDGTSTTAGTSSEAGGHSSRHRSVLLEKLAQE